MSSPVGEAAISAEPEERALDHPATRQHDDAVHIVRPFDDLHAQDRHFGHSGLDLPGVVTAIGPDQFEPGKAPAYLVEDQPGTVAVLDRGGVDDDPHRQSLGVDQGVDLAALHLLAGEITETFKLCKQPLSSDGDDPAAPEGG
jgi:hypothetical protein